MNDDSFESGWNYSDAFFKDVIRTAVPERKTEIDALLAKHQIVFVPDEERKKIRFRVSLVSKRVEIATVPLFRLWGHIFAYLLFYDALSQAHLNKQHAADLTVEGSAFSMSISVLKWAMAADVAASIDPKNIDSLDDKLPEYPKSLPPPFQPGSSDAAHKVASDLTTLALGFVLLHEIAHVEFAHVTDQAVRVEQENEADRWAANFMLEHCDKYADEKGFDVSRVRTKRLQAMVMVWLWYVHKEVHYGIGKSNTHPPSYDRLSSLLEQHAEDPNDVAWSMAGHVLALHYQTKYGMSQQVLEFDNHRDFYQHYADLLANQAR